MFKHINEFFKGFDIIYKLFFSTPELPLVRWDTHLCQEKLTVTVSVFHFMTEDI